MDPGTFMSWANEIQNRDDTALGLEMQSNLK